MIGMGKGKLMSAMMRYVMVSLVVLVVLLTGGYYVYNNYLRTPEEKILAGVERLRLAGEDKSARKVMAEIAPEYSDTYNPNREALAEKVNYWCVQHLKDEVKVTISGLRVQIAPDGKSATVRLLLSGNDAVMSVLKLLNEKGAIELDYRNKDGNWLISGGRSVQ